MTAWMHAGGKPSATECSGNTLSRTVKMWFKINIIRVLLMVFMVSGLLPACNSSSAEATVMTAAPQKPEKAQLPGTGQSGQKAGQTNPRKATPIPSCASS